MSTIFLPHKTGRHLWTLRPPIRSSELTHTSRRPRIYWSAWKKTSELILEVHYRNTGVMTSSNSGNKPKPILHKWSIRLQVAFIFKFTLGRKYTNINALLVYLYSKCTTSILLGTKLAHFFRLIKHILSIAMMNLYTTFSFVLQHVFDERVWWNYTTKFRLPFKFSSYQFFILVKMNLQIILSVVLHMIHGSQSLLCFLKSGWAKGKVWVMMCRVCALVRLLWFHGWRHPPRAVATASDAEHMYLSDRTHFEHPESIEKTTGDSSEIQPRRKYPDVSSKRNTLQSSTNISTSPRRTQNVSKRMSEMWK